MSESDNPANPETSGKIHAYRRAAMIVTGLYLYLFIASHLTNLTLGLHSVDLMDRMRPILTGYWTLRVTSLILVACLLVHFGCALWSLYLRNTLKVPRYDLLQLIAGLLIIPLLAPHVIGVLTYVALGIEPNYYLLLKYYWMQSPYEGLRQVLMLVMAWFHGSIGIFTWLDARDGSKRLMAFFYPLVILIPIAALLGYVEGGRHVIAAEKAGLGQPIVTLAERSPLSDAEVFANKDLANQLVFWITVGLIAFTLLARFWRLARQRREKVKVEFTGPRPARFTSETGLSLLEMTRVHDVPHPNICRGRGRCGTCRVRLLQVDSELDPPSEAEQKTLDHWKADGDTRLACQIFPGRGRFMAEPVVAADYSDLDYGQTSKAQKP